MSIVRLVVGAFTTLKHPGLKKILEEVQAADAKYKQEIQGGSLTKPNKEREAAANDAAVLLKKYVDAKGKPTAAFHKDLMPFYKPQELVASINHAHNQKTTQWADFDEAYEKVIAYANKRKGENLFARDDGMPRPWAGMPEADALDWAWGPLLDCIEEGDSPEEVKETVQLRVHSVNDGLRDLELVRTASVVRGLRKVLREAKRLRAELQAEKDTIGLFRDIDELQADLKRAGQGRPRSIPEIMRGAKEEFMGSPFGRVTEPGQA